MEHPTKVHQPRFVVLLYLIQKWKFPIYLLIYRSHQDPELLMSNSSPTMTSEQTSPATQHNTCHTHDSEETNKSIGSSNTNCDNITTTVRNFTYYIFIIVMLKVQSYSQTGALNCFSILQYSQGGPLIYAELAPAQANPVSQPSSTENTTYAVLNHSTETT